MNNTAFPFMNMDMTKVMAEFDPAKFGDQFAKFAGGYKLPEVDVDAIIDAQRKNFEAINAANKAAVEGAQALVKRQNEIIQDAVNEATSAVSDLSKSEGIEDATAKHAELLKVSFEKALGNVKELAELVAKSNTESAELINARITETLDDIRKQAVKVKKQKK